MITRAGPAVLFGINFTESCGEAAYVYEKKRDVSVENQNGLFLAEPGFAVAMMIFFSDSQSKRRQNVRVCVCSCFVMAAEIACHWRVSLILFVPRKEEEEKKKKTDYLVAFSL